MHHANPLHHSKYLASALVMAALFSSGCAWAAQVEPKLGTGNNEDAFVFAGTCPSGEPYRLFAYQQNSQGLVHSFYDFEGPAGKGTVRSDVYPKVMAARVCRKLAEIINANYWE